MEPSDIVGMIDEIWGKPCRIETTDGSVRHGIVTDVENREIKFGNATIGYPIALMFDKATGDGVELHIIAKIDIDLAVK